MLAEEPLTADAVKGGQHAGHEQLLGRDAGAPQFLLELVEDRGEPLEHGIDLALDRAHGMIGGDGGVKVQDGEECGLGPRFWTHAVETHPGGTVFIFTRDLINSLLGIGSRTD